MPDTVADVGLVVLESLDFDLECESIHHYTGIFDHGGPAEFVQVGGCSRCSGLRCAPIVLDMLANPDEDCAACGDTSMPKFFPIPKGRQS